MFPAAYTVPQAQENHRKAWAKIEKATRKHVIRPQGDVYRISGPVFDEALPTIGQNRVCVPQHLFKLAYDPMTNRV